MKRATPLKRSPLRRKPRDPDQVKAQRSRARRRQRELWERDFGPHSDYVRQHPCTACGSWREIESHHEPDRRHGGSMKDQAPLCRDCHREGPRARHRIGRKRFEAERKVDMAAAAARIWGKSPHNPERMAA